MSLKLQPACWQLASQQFDSNAPWTLLDTSQVQSAIVFTLVILSMHMFAEFA